MYIVHTQTHTPPEIRKQSQEYPFLQRSILLCYVVVTKGRQTNWNSRSSLWWSLSWAMEQRSKNWNRCSGMVSIYFPNILEMILKGFWHWWKWMDQRGGGFPGIESQTQKYLSKLWNPMPSHKLNWHVHTCCLLFQSSCIIIIGGKASLPPSSGPSKKTWTWKGDIFCQHLAFRGEGSTAL